MNNHFNYELDERQIRLLMQDAEIIYNEAAWNSFESHQSVGAKSKKVTVDYFPKVNFGVNRSIIIPILFIASIGTLSALLFNFVDFKKKPNELKEIPLIASVPITKPAESTVSKTHSLPAKDEPSSKPKQLPIVKEENKKQVVTPTININKSSTEETAIIKEESKPLIIEKSSPTKHKKKRKRKITSEEIPTINTTSNLSEPASEPELKIN